MTCVHIDPAFISLRTMPEYIALTALKD